MHVADSHRMGIVALATLLFDIDLNRWARGKDVFVFRVGRLLHGQLNATGSAAGA